MNAWESIQEIVRSECEYDTRIILCVSISMTRREMVSWIARKSSSWARLALDLRLAMRIRNCCVTLEYRRGGNLANRSWRGEFCAGATPVTRVIRDEAGTSLAGNKKKIIKISATRRTSESAREFSTPLSGLETGTFVPTRTRYNEKLVILYAHLSKQRPFTFSRYFARSIGHSI